MYAQLCMHSVTAQPASHCSMLKILLL